MEVELKELRAKMETMQADHAQAEAAAKAKLGKFKAALEEREAQLILSFYSKDILCKTLRIFSLMDVNNFRGFEFFYFLISA